MKIYTKTGDTGETSLLSGSRVPKTNARIEAYGSLDETNSFLGLVRDTQTSKERVTFLTSVQETLFNIGSLLAADKKELTDRLPKITDHDITEVERAIDAMEKDLTPLRNFILPGGHPHISYCHMARSVCRRSERQVIKLSETADVPLIIIRYLNRLSDYLFVLSRTLAVELNIKETPWKPRK